MWIYFWLCHGEGSRLVPFFSFPHLSPATFWSSDWPLSAVFEPMLIRRQMIFNKLVMLKMFLSAVSTGKHLQLLLSSFCSRFFSLSACIFVGLFVMSIMAMVLKTHRRFMYCCTDYYNYLADKGILSSIVGGLTLGVGLALSGSVSTIYRTPFCHAYCTCQGWSWISFSLLWFQCPTSVFTQLGALVPNAGKCYPFYVIFAIMHAYTQCIMLLLFTGYTFLGAVSGTLFYGIMKPAFDKVLQPEIQESSNP